MSVSLPQIGAAYVSGLDAAGLSALGKAAGVSSVEPERVLKLVKPVASTRLAGSEPQSPTNPAGSIWYDLQWNMGAIGADLAWEAGELGSQSVTVAIIDTGLDYTHYDLQGRVDLQRSRSFLPEEDAVIAQYLTGLNPVFDLHGHGTHVGATVASDGVETGEITHYPSLYATYCNSPHVVCVSATGPSSTDDIYYGPFHEMAAPHVAGLAALMVQKHGKNPSKVANAIKKSADDLGQKGTDPFYGKGRINVAKALGVN